MIRRSAQSLVPRRSYTHTFCCLADHKANKVPSIQLKADLLAAGLGEQKVTFSGLIVEIYQSPVLIVVHCRIFCLFVCFFFIFTVNVINILSF